jgi:hypothetical protein
MSYSIAEMKALSMEKGYHWFDKDTIRFFNTKIISPCDKWNMFVTSERMDEDHPKKYSIRLFVPSTSKVITVGDFHSFDTIEELKKVRREISLAFAEMGNREKEVFEHCNYATQEGNIITFGSTELQKFFLVRIDGQSERRIVG